MLELHASAVQALQPARQLAAASQETLTPHTFVQQVSSILDRLRDCACHTLADGLWHKAAANNAKLCRLMVCMRVPTGICWETWVS